MDTATIVERFKDLAEMARGLNDGQKQALDIMRSLHEQVKELESRVAALERGRQ